MSVDRPYVFQQDGAPAHMSHKVQNWLDDNFDMFWPSDSPDINLRLTYYFWSVVERESNKHSHNYFESLLAASQDSRPPCR